jgi:hypothetical protein
MHNRRTLQKVTSGELLTKQVMRKKYYKKDTHILKLFLNVVTARIEAKRKKGKAVPVGSHGGL